MYMKTLFSQNQRDNLSFNDLRNAMENRPVTPLPNPGEGGAVNNGTGNMNNGNTDSELPGEGMTAPETNQENQLVTPLPNPGEGGPVFPGIPGGTNGNNQGNRPIIPLPNPGEGGPVFPGNMGGQGNMGTGNMGQGTGGLNIPAIIGTIITTLPRPNAPCRFCANQNQTYGNVRFLNAAAGYNPFRIYVNDQLFVSPLNFSEITSYDKVPGGYQIVTVVGDNQYIYVQKPIMVPRDASITVAICNTENGIDLFVISDTSCNRSNFVSCLRVCNLSVNSGPLTVVLGNNEVSFMNVGYQEVTNFKVMPPARYLFYVLNNNRNILLSSSVDVKADASYTMYLFNWNISSPDAITVMIVEES